MLIVREERCVVSNDERHGLDARAGLFVVACRERSREDAHEIRLMRDAVEAVLAACVERVQHCVHAAPVRIHNNTRHQVKAVRQELLIGADRFVTLPDGGLVDDVLDLNTIGDDHHVGTITHDWAPFRIGVISREGR